MGSQILGQVPSSGSLQFQALVHDQPRHTDSAPWPHNFAACCASTRRSRTGANDTRIGHSPVLAIVLVASNCQGHLAKGRLQGTHRMSCTEACRSRREESERATSRLRAVTAPATPSTLAAAILHGMSRLSLGCQAGSGGCQAVTGPAMHSAWAHPERFTLASLAPSRLMCMCTYVFVQNSLLLSSKTCLLGRPQTGPLPQVLCPNLIHTAASLCEIAQVRSLQLWHGSMHGTLHSVDLCVCDWPSPARDMKLLGVAASSGPLEQDHT